MKTDIETRIRNWRNNSPGADHPLVITSRELAGLCMNLHLHHTASRDRLALLMPAGAEDLPPDLARLRATACKLRKSLRDTTGEGECILCGGGTPDMGGSHFDNCPITVFLAEISVVEAGEPSRLEKDLAETEELRYRAVEENRNLGVEVLGLRRQLKDMTDECNEFREALDGYHDDRDKAEARSETLTKALSEMTEDRDFWRHSAEMACQNPPDDCECPGCLLAAEENPE